ncbi:replication initiation protein [Aureibacter tunicatorum]|uniref:Plasmid replication initiation protein n=1 Tax=Aureibacter tunicatorum TaxID=866807 RepID=A0AAE4BVG5_9BACT|nr:replication initiation protein [Aureibacter tunicatorum]MDR6242080.1 plasmid replication initiation protein [Aureibacter tunicatorum]BDD07567.1 hypothetical protein AUTU_50500 [Aureibacter tunicatorum]
MTLILSPNMLDYKIIKSNKYINSKQSNISINAQKILVFAMAMIKPEDTEFMDIQIPVRLILGKGDQVLQGYDYKKVKEAASELMDLRIEIERSDGRWKKINFVSTSEGQDGAPFIKFRFNDAAKPYLLNLRDNYTQYVLKYVNNFKTNFSFRIYEICRQYLKIGKREISVDRFRMLLNLEHKHKRWQDLRREVIEKSLKEINEYSDIHVAYEVLKTGRRITDIVFLISPNTNSGFNEKMLGMPIEMQIKSGYHINEAVRGMEEMIPMQEKSDGLEKNSETREEEIARLARIERKKLEEQRASVKSELYNQYYLDIRKEYVTNFGMEFKKKYVDWVQEHGNLEERKSLQELIELRDKASQKCWNFYGTFLIRNYGTSEDRKWLDIDAWWEDNKSIEQGGGEEPF